MGPPSGAGPTPDSSRKLSPLLLGARLRHVCFFEENVENAFCLAEKAHRGQKRVSGHPYLQHCVETAEILASRGAVPSLPTVVAAGLLHDTLDDSHVTYDEIVKSCGAGVAGLVKQVSLLSHLSKLARDSNTASKRDEAVILRTVFLVMADAGALLIKLADRLHNMRTLDVLPQDKRYSIANETLEIFAPLANRLGISIWKEELENLCFQHLYPCQHEKLSKCVELFPKRMIKSAKEKLSTAVTAKGIHCKLSGRQKSLYGIFSKMVKNKLKINQLHDIHGLRLIVDKKKDCYTAQDVVYEQWVKVPEIERHKDYIRVPKLNGYRSLHTVVHYEGKVPLEVQIRTEKMHEKAESSSAAHWIYKEEGPHGYPEFVQQVVNWHCETINSSDLHLTRPPCTFPSHSGGGQEGPVFVIIKDKDKMSVKEFPANKTRTDLLDLLEDSRPGGSRSKEELKPRLYFRPVSDPTCKLKVGDVLELTSAQPQRSKSTWLKPPAQPQSPKSTLLKPSAGPRRHESTGFKVPPIIRNKSWSTVWEQKTGESMIAS